jgi:hypothetical protein
LPRFTADGSKLVVIAANREGSVWPTTLDDWEKHACAAAGRNLTRAEWSQFITGHEYTRLCTHLPGT